MITLAFLSMGLSEMVLIAVVALLVFGGRLPEVMHSLGKTYAKFRRGMSELSHPIRHELRRLDAAATTPRPSTPDRGNVPAAEEPPPYDVPDLDSSTADSQAPTPDPDTDTEPPRSPTSGGGAIDEPPPV